MSTLFIIKNRYVDVDIDVGGDDDDDDDHEFPGDYGTYGTTILISNSILSLSLNTSFSSSHQK